MSYVGSILQMHTPVLVNQIQISNNRFITLIKLHATKFSDFIAFLVMLLICGENNIEEWNKTLRYR